MLLCSLMGALLADDDEAPVPNSKGNPFSGEGAQNTRGGKILRFSTEITVYLGNGNRYPMVATKR